MCKTQAGIPVRAAFTRLLYSHVLLCAEVPAYRYKPQERMVDSHKERSR